MSIPRKYFFILGRNQELSIFEILIQLQNKGCNFNILEILQDTLIIEIAESIDVYKFALTLSGTIKIGRIWVESDLKSFEELMAKSSFYIEDSKVINYSIECFGKDIPRETIEQFFKQEFKKQKQKALIKNLPPHAMAKAIKLKEFIDIVVIMSKSTGLLLFGRTEGAYDIDEDKKKYEQRPFINEIIGSSIRIARILVNLAGLKEGSTILDPFCGIGTVLQEALISGLNAYGIEINHERVKQAQANLKWAKTTFKFKGDFKVISGDAKELSKYIPNVSLDAIITEPELGPFLKENPDSKTARSYITNLFPLYKAVFKESNKMIKPGGKLVIVLPQYITNKNSTESLSLNDLISSTSFQVYNPLKDLNISSINQFNLQIPINYKEKWHIINRQIYIFIKK
jgi:tRNA G10  N-methylase Trm11